MRKADMLKSHNQIKIGALLSYFSIGLNLLAGLLYTPWMVSQIGQIQYGLYTLANSVISLFLVDFGLGSATSRYVAKLHAVGDEEGVSNFLGLVYKLYLGIDAVIFLALVLIFFFIDIIYAKWTPEELFQFKIVYVIAASYSVLYFPFITLNGVMTGYEKFIQLKLADVIQRVLTVGLTVAALIMGLGLYAMVAVNAFAGLVVIAYKMVVVWKGLTIRVNFRYFDRCLLKEIFGFSIWSTVAALSQRLVFNIMPSILGAVSTTTAIAVFGVITTLEAYSYTIVNAVNGMFMHRVARIYSDEGANQKILPLMLNVGRFQFGLNGLIVAGFVVIGREFILLWMGPQYIDAYLGVLLVIIPGMFFSALQIGHTAIVITKHVNLYAGINLTMGILNVVLSVPLSREFGVIGACVSIFIVYMFRAMALNLLYAKKLDIDMTFFIRRCYLNLLVPVLLTVFLSKMICKYIQLDGWSGLICKGGLVALIYVANLALLALGDRK